MLKKLVILIPVFYIIVIYMVEISVEYGMYFAGAGYISLYILPPIVADLIVSEGR